MKYVFMLMLCLVGCESEDDQCPLADIDALNQSLPADCGCGTHVNDGCVSCEVYVDGERVGFFDADCREITCCHRGQ